jgi:hypothetical protein
MRSTCLIRLWTAVDARMDAELRHCALAKNDRVASPDQVWQNRAIGSRSGKGAAIETPIPQARANARRGIGVSDGRIAGIRAPTTCTGRPAAST